MKTNHFLAKPPNFNNSGDSIPINSDTGFPVPDLLNVNLENEQPPNNIVTPVNATIPIIEPVKNSSNPDRISMPPLNPSVIFKAD